MEGIILDICPICDLALPEPMNSCIKCGVVFAKFQKAQLQLKIIQSKKHAEYQSERYQQMTQPSILAVRPYWRYIAIVDASTQPEHAALHGKIFRYDHAFWKTWYPPNSATCRCTVTTVSEKAMAREGWRIEDKDPTGILFEPINIVTGKKLPARPLLPDSDWAHNLANAPGAS